MSLRNFTYSSSLARKVN